MKGEMKVMRVNGGYEKKGKMGFNDQKMVFYFVESDALPDTETSVGLRRTTLSLTSSRRPASAISPLRSGSAGQLTKNF